MGTKIREIPDLAIKFIKNEEGCILHSYADIVGKMTIGIGHLIRKGEDFSAGLTEDEAEKLLRKDLYSTADAVCRLTNVSISDNQYSALLSLVFNIGSGNYQASTLRSQLNRGEYSAAADEFPKWCWAGGKKSKGLYNRRIREHNLFLSDNGNGEVDA